MCLYRKERVLSSKTMIRNVNKCIKFSVSPLNMSQNLYQSNIFYFFKGVQLQKKWKNIRDCFRRELRRLNSEGDLPYKRLYRNYDLLSFLEPIMCIGQNTSAKEESYQDLELFGKLTQAPKARLSKRRKKHVEQNINEMAVFEENNSKEPEVPEIYTSATTGDGDTLFMMSLISEMKKIPENKRLHVKVKLMNVILEAQES